MIAVSLLVTFLFALSIFVLPESPRWLFSKGKLEEAERVLKWIGKLNGKDTSLVVFEKHSHFNEFRGQKVNELQPSTKCSQDKQPVRKTRLSILSLCSTFRGQMLFFTHLLTWSASAFVYFALIFKAQEIGTNLYTCSIFLSLCELPTLLLFKSVDKIGHKTIVLWGLLLGQGF